MNERSDGGPTFTSKGVKFAQDTRYDTFLRDGFASKVISQILHVEALQRGESLVEAALGAATQAYVVADAMLEARKK